MPTWFQSMLPMITEYGIKVLGAIVIWFVGRWIIGKLNALLGVALGRQKMDPTLVRYISSIISVLLNIFLILAILNQFGINTTSFAALIAAAGLAIGAAWSGMLSNFASGVFLVLFKPFKVGDYVSVAGIEGTVSEVGMFATTINTPANVHTILGNGKIAGEIIQNYSTNAHRAVDLRAQIANGVKPTDAIALLQPVIAAIPNVLASPAPTIDIMEFNEYGTKLVVRPFCHNDHYWQVYFDTQRAIAATFAGAGYPVPSSYQTEYEYKMD